MNEIGPIFGQKFEKSNDAMLANHQVLAGLHGVNACQYQNQDHQPNTGDQSSKALEPNVGSGVVPMANAQPKIV